MPGEKFGWEPSPLDYGMSPLSYALSPFDYGRAGAPQRKLTLVHTKAAP